jgi:hypothetical protein
MTKDELKALPLEERGAKLLEIYNSKDRKCSMFSKAGDKRVQRLISKCMKKLFGKAIRQADYEAYVEKEIAKVAAQDKYSEVWDTAVREVIYYWLEMAIEIADYDWARDFEFS